MSVTPRRFSSRATFALTVVLGTPSRRAAPLKLPACTTFTKIAMPSSSMGRHYAGKKVAPAEAGAGYCAGARLLKLRRDERGSRFSPLAAIEAHRTRSGEDKQQENEAVQRGELAAVQHRRDDVALRGMRDEVRNGHHAGHHERRRPCVQADADQQSARYLQHAGKAEEREEFEAVEHRLVGESEQLCRAVLDEQIRRDDAQRGERIGCVRLKSFLLP